MRRLAIFLPFLGVSLGYISVFITAFCVQFGLLYNKGIIGLVSFPIYEELIKLIVVWIFVKILKTEIDESMVLAFMTGIGFRIVEMSIKYQSWFTFLFPALLHGGWVCSSIYGIYEYENSHELKYLGYVCFAIITHLLWNIIMK